MVNYKGICKKLLSDGKVVDTVVEDISGNQMAFDPHLYQQRGILPLLDDLPICGQHEASIEINEKEVKLTEDEEQDAK
jgi:hypothetical protein